MTRSIESYQDDHLDPDEEYRLIETVQNGTSNEGERTDEAQQALDQLVRSNIRLVIDRVRTEIGRVTDDYLQQGFVGFVEAVERFDVDSGYRLSSYATFWIKRKVHHYINTKENTGRSVRTIQLYRRIQRIRRSLTESGTTDSIDNIADKLNERPERIRSVLRQTRDCVSIDQDRKEGQAIQEVIGRSSDEFQGLLHREILSLIKIGLNQLSERPRRFIVQYHGLFGSDSHTYKEIGNQHGYSQSRIAQLVHKGYDQLQTFFQEQGYVPPFRPSPDTIVDGYTE